MAKIKTFEPTPYARGEKPPPDPTPEEIASAMRTIRAEAVRQGLGPRPGVTPIETQRQRYAALALEARCRAAAERQAFAGV